MKVVKNEPRQPSPTYDLIGLTEEEAQYLTTLLGSQPAKCTAGTAYLIYEKLFDAGLRWTPPKC